MVGSAFSSCLSPGCESRPGRPISGLLLANARSALAAGSPGDEEDTLSRLASFRTLRPPRLEVAKTHSSPSRTHLSQGGSPGVPLLSLDGRRCQLVMAVLFQQPRAFMVSEFLYTNLQLAFHLPVTASATSPPRNSLHSYRIMVML